MKQFNKHIDPSWELCAEKESYKAIKYLFVLSLPPSLLSSASVLGALSAAVTAIPIKYGRSKFRGTYQELWLNAFWLTHCLPPSPDISLRSSGYVSGFLVYTENSKPARETRPNSEWGGGGNGEGYFEKRRRKGKDTLEPNDIGD